MNRRFCASVVAMLASGCSDSDDGTVRAVSYDIVVSKSFTGLVPTYDLNGCMGSAYTRNAFPAVGGECTGSTDAYAIDCGWPVTCIETAEIDGVSAGLAMMYSAALVVPVAVTDASTLTLTGCGETATIPLHAGELPTATLNVATSPTTVDLDWTTDRAVASSIISFSNVYSTVRCNVAATSHVFATDPTGITVAVQPLDEVETYATPFGELRVRRGNITGKEL